METKIVINVKNRRENDEEDLSSLSDGYTTSEEKNEYQTGISLMSWCPSTNHRREDTDSEGRASNKKSLSKEATLPTNVAADSHVNVIVLRDSARPFPDVFFCPITKKLLSDPVVMFHGNSYERGVIKDTGCVLSEHVYPNRALKAIIEETIAINERRATRSVLKQIQRRLDKILERTNIISYVLMERWHRPLPDSFYCPITFSLMNDPVIDKDGYTYEKDAIVNWIWANGTSPITKTAAIVNDLYPNNAIKALIKIETEREKNFQHPAIRRWIAEKNENHEGKLELPHKTKPSQRSGVPLTWGSSSNNYVSGLCYFVLFLLVAFSIFIFLSSLPAFTLF